MCQQLFLQEMDAQDIERGINGTKELREEWGGDKGLGVKVFKSA